jgi:GT2 family glycosyltransferase
MEKIFVQIASYRDLQLIPTIEDMLEKAKYPERLTFGICWQYDETEEIDKYDGKENFRIKKYHYSKSKGLGWARSETNKLYKGEKYTLQIDSHHRFVKHWDVILLEDYNQALQLSDKPIISTYCTPFDPTQSEDKWNPQPCLMSQYEFSADKLLMSMPWFIPNYKSLQWIIRARTISGHFFFCDGKFIKEVPYDPDIYFGGYTEETSMSLRAFTHGYDFFSPYRMIMWHEYSRSYRPKHWDDHGIKSATKKTSGERDIYARDKVRQLFGTEDHGIKMGKYGLGKIRTLKDYEIYGGFDFKKCRIQDYTLQVKEPPNPPDWESQFLTTTHRINCEWDLDFFKKFNFENPKFLTLGVHDRYSNELYRKDFTVENNPEYVKLGINYTHVSFASEDYPSKIVMYLYDEKQGWSERYEKNI